MQPAAPIPRSLADLRGPCAERVLVSARSGSHLYGLATASSDEDERGLFVLPADAYGGLREPVEHLQDERGDVVYQSLRKFLGLAAGANPNALEILFLPHDCLLSGSPAFECLVAERELFLTKRCFDSHVGYARAQIRRAKGRNKWVHNPQPETPPPREDFCRVVLGPWPGDRRSDDDSTASTPPLRPRPLSDSGLDLSQCHCSSMEHVEGGYRLYHLGADARGVFRGGQIVCESIPIEREFDSLVGLLLFDERSYRKALDDHRNYHAWKRDRNEARWRTQERGEIDYDAKNMMHAFRLVDVAAGLLRDGEFRVRVTDEERAELLKVRAGSYPYAELVDRLETAVADLAPLVKKSRLPDAPDLERVDELLAEVTRMHERSVDGPGGRRA